jgi:hypothetical protein
MNIPDVYKDPEHYGDATVAITEVDAGKCYGVLRTSSMWEMPSCSPVRFEETSENRLALLHVAALFRPLS